jgi:hypothetical protein
MSLWTRSKAGSPAHRCPSELFQNCDAARLLDEACRSASEAERFRGLEIEEQLEFGRLLDRQISGLCTFQNFVDVGCCAAEIIGKVLPIRHQKTGRGPPPQYRPLPAACVP